LARGKLKAQAQRGRVGCAHSPVIHHSAVPQWFLRRSNYRTVRPHNHSQHLSALVKSILLFFFFIFNQIHHVSKK
jgi:hypothetical protein